MEDKKKKIQECLAPSSRKKTLLQAMAISALLYGLRILFLEIPQILLSESGSIEEMRAIGRLMVMPFYFLLSTGILYFVISWIKNRKSKD